MFVASWVNPDEKLADKQFEDYMKEGVFAALDAIVAEIEAAHAQGQDVARLHSGDLSIWSAMGEQLRRLRALDIPFTITPGVPAFAAAAADGGFAAPRGSGYGEGAVRPGGRRGRMAGAVCVGRVGGARADRERDGRLAVCPAGEWRCVCGGGGDAGGRRTGSASVCPPIPPPRSARSSTPSTTVG